MIETWRDDWLKGFFVENLPSQKILADLRDRLFRKLQLIDDAATEADLRIPPGNHFEKLSGKLAGWHSIRVNEQWRLIFMFAEGAAHDIYLNNHSYR